MKIIPNDLKIKYETPMKMFCDNKSAITIAHSPIHHDKIKHIEIDRHFIKEKLDKPQHMFLQDTSWQMC